MYRKPKAVNLAFFNNCFKNGILPLVLPQAQVDVLMARAQEFPSEPITVDLERQQVVAGNNVFSFEIDPFRKRCLMGGLDDIGLTLEKDPAIAAYEQRNQSEKSWLWG